MNPQELELKKLVGKLFLARYVPDAQAALDEIKKLPLSDEEKVTALLTTLEKEVKNVGQESVDHRFPQLQLPKKLTENNLMVRQYLAKDFELLKASSPDVSRLEEFMIKEHENIKWSQNRWFITNPGLTLEVVQITNDYPQEMLDWLKNQGVNIGDFTIHLHVISNNGRVRLKDMGHDVPDSHWSGAYYRDMIEMAKKVIRLEDKFKGLFCDGSWIFNKQNFDKAPDGKPFVAFTFLKNRSLVGEILNITDLVSKKDYLTQKNFALRSERRKQYFDQGLFDVQLHATFLSRDVLLTNSS